VSEPAAPTAPTVPSPTPPSGRAQALIQALQLQPHPEGGWYREIYRATDTVQPAHGRGERSTLTSVDFLLRAGERSAWHRVAADEAWHLLEGDALRLWLVSPDLQQVQAVALGPVDGTGRRPRHVVPAMWWQAAEPINSAESAHTATDAGFSYVGATVGPGFDFADFTFGRDDAALCEALRQHRSDALRLL